METLKVALLQIEDRTNPYFDFCIQNNRVYCKKHNIDHIFLETGPADICVYYWKVKVFLDLLNKTDYDIICWMDSDAFVFNKSYDIRNFFKGISESMIIAPDPEKWPSPFMAAVYMARNNENTKKIFQDWLKNYDPKRWKKNPNGSWVCMGKCQWAGEQYEQGSFVKHILPKYKSDIKSIKWYVFHEINCQLPHKDCWSIHIPGPIKQRRPNCIVFEKTRQQNISNTTILYSMTILVILLVILLCYLYIKMKKS